MSARDLDPSQYEEADRREVDPPIQVEMATWRPGASSIGGSKSTGHAWSGSGGYAGPMAGSGGSKLVIFVAPAAHSHELPLCRPAGQRNPPPPGEAPSAHERRHGDCRPGVLKNGSSPPGRPRSASLVWRSRFAPHRRHSSVTRWVRSSTATICQACQPIKHLNGRAFITPTFRSE